MELVSLQSVAKGHGHRPVLTDVTFRINAGQKVGLIGANGAGKTSILRIVLKEEQADGGAVTVSRDLRIGYVPQYVEHDDGDTLIGSIVAANTRAAEKLQARADRLAAATGERVPEAVHAYEAAREAYERAGGDQIRERAIGMLDALGLAGRADQLVGVLSGGEKNVLSLTRALLAEPDLLLLDEPGNHLDFEGIAWLEGYLSSFKGAVLIVSHNRYLLDRVVDGILHLEDGRVRTYAGNYSAFRATALREKLAQRADYVANQKRLEQLEAVVKRFEEFARRTADPKWGKRLRARRSQLARERRDAVEKPRAETSAMRVRFETEASGADIALHIRGYEKSFGELRLFEQADLDIFCGERVVILGPNGSGKTTLVRDVVEHGAWDHPIIRVGPSLRIGYCAQEQEVLEDARTVLDELMRAGSISRERAFAVLAQFLFGADDLDKRVGDLSRGERNRLQLAKVMLEKPSFLILDEPTNHLDIPAREAVEDVLSSFEGTILLVSHDRYLLDKVATRVVEVRDRGLVSHEGNFSEYWHSREAAKPRATARVATRRRVREAPARKHPSRERGAAPNELDDRIAELEGEKLALERRVSDAFTRGDHREGQRASRQLEQLTARLDEMYQRWLAEGS